MHAVTIQVYELPVANAVVTAGTSNPTADTILICLGSNNTVQLNGDSLSLHETTWNWDILTNNGGSIAWIPPTMNSPFDESNLPHPKLVFNAPGIYVLELTVSNPCGAKDTDRLIFKVVASPSAVLNLNESDCTPITLNPSDYLTTIGILTGCEWDFGAAGTSMECDPGNITFTTTTLVIFQGFNECSTIVDTGYINITQSGQAIITNPCPDTLCTNDPPCTLSVNIPGGVWQNNGLPAGPIFNPATASVGNHVITYGAPPCILPAQVEVFVIDNAVQINGPDEICIDGGPVVFTATPSGGVFSSTSGAIDASGVYDPTVAGPGPDEISYVTGTNSFCPGQASLDVEVVQLAVGFEVTDCNGLQISFGTTAGTSSFSSILWNFGDGQTSTQAAPTHTYAMAGSYEVTVTIMAGICPKSFTDSITIVAPPVAGFSLLYDSPACGPLLVTLTNTSTGGDLTYVWNIGGTIINGQDPNPIVLDNTATISLTLSNDCGTSIYSEVVAAEPNPIAGFGVNAYVCSGDTIEVYNVASLYDSLYWDFGNGQTSTDTGTVQSVVYFTMTENDTFQIVQIATNDCTPDTLIQDVIVVPTDAFAQVTWTAVPQSQACQNEAICFQSFSTPSGIPLNWDFGDGNTAIGLSVCHAWTAPGTYKIVAKLISCGFDSTVFNITVLPIPDAAFAPPTGCPGVALVFDNQSVGAIGYSWQFGTGDSSILVSPTYAYDSAGVYQACLIATSDMNMCRDTVCHAVTVSPPPVPSFTVANPGCQGDIVQFTSTSSSDVVLCEWDFGDGNLSAACNAEHVFGAPGTYLVTLTVTNADGCTASSSQNVLVGEIPIPGFTFMLSDSCHPDLVIFTNTSLLAEGYAWDFGDGNTSTLTSPQHVYDNAGTFTVQLTAISDGVCFASISQPLTIHETPTALIGLQGNSICFGESLSFQDNSTGSISNLEWDFGDGLFSFEENPVHTFADSGMFQVVLTVYNGILCQDDTSVWVTVHPAVTANVVATDLACNGVATGAIDLTVTSGTPPFEYDWSNGAETEDLSSLFVGNYSVTITDPNACSWTETITIGQPTALLLSLTSEDIVTCAGGADGGVCVEASGGVPDYTILWGTGVSGECITDVAAGSYPVSLTDANDCLLLDTFTVQENPIIEITDSVLSRPCFGEDIAFIRIDDVQGGAGGYSISLEGNNGYFQMGYNFGHLQPGPYLLTVTDALGCFLEKNYIITEPDSIWLDILADSIVLELGADTILYIAHNLGQPIYEWSPVKWLDCSDCPDPTASPFDDIQYVLTMTDGNDCRVSDRVNVKVDKIRDVYIPNIFTPNDDGRNDRFWIRASVKSIKQVNVFSITDRWGELVFEAKDFDPLAKRDQDGWSGTFRGKKLAPDTYYYFAQIEFKDGVVKGYQGTVTLVW